MHGTSHPRTVLCMACSDRMQRFRKRMIPGCLIQSISDDFEAIARKSYIRNDIACSCDKLLAGKGVILCGLAEASTGVPQCARSQLDMAYSLAANLCPIHLNARKVTSLRATGDKRSEYKSNQFRIPHDQRMACIHHCHRLVIMH
jgi:hypothetical protein